jgi:hypothetical protein
MAANELQTSQELVQQILKTKSEEPTNYKKIQRLQQLLDKLEDKKKK